MREGGREGGREGEREGEGEGEGESEKEGESENKREHKFYTDFRFFCDNDVQINVSVYKMSILISPDRPLYTHQTVLLS